MEASRFHRFRKHQQLRKKAQKRNHVFQVFGMCYEAWFPLCAILMNKLRLYHVRCLSLLCTFSIGWIGMFASVDAIRALSHQCITHAQRCSGIVCGRVCARASCLYCLRSYMHVFGCHAHDFVASKEYLYNFFLQFLLWQDSSLQWYLCCPTATLYASSESTSAYALAYPPSFANELLFILMMIHYYDQHSALQKRQSGKMGMRFNSHEWARTEPFVDGGMYL